MCLIAPGCIIYAGFRLSSGSVEKVRLGAWACELVYDDLAAPAAAQLLPLGWLGDAGTRSLWIHAIYLHMAIVLPLRRGAN